MIIFKEVNWSDTDNALNVMKENLNKLIEMDNKAKAEGKLVGRYIDHPIADGKAYYLIIKENKNTVRIESVGGIGDDWTIPAWGDSCSISKANAVQLIEARDSLAELFRRK